MRHRLLFVICGLAVSTALFAQASGGQISRHKPLTSQGNSKKTVNKNARTPRTRNYPSQPKQQMQKVDGYNVTFNCNVPSANMTIDGIPNGSVNSGTRFLETGQHTITILADGYETQTHNISVNSVSRTFSFYLNKEEDMTIYEVVDQMPQFPGGDVALMQFLSSHIKYPVEAEENGIQGCVVCTLVIETNGSITDVKVVNRVDPFLDKEAIRVIQRMPNWIPGKKNGKPVRVKYTTRITFKLE